MRRMTRSWLLLTALVLLAHAAAGCGRTLDGSAEFNEQHPEYQNGPAYLHPNDTDRSDAPVPRQW